MGMSASQMRLLSLTARMSDIEYSAQQISNDRQRLSVKTEQISQEYTDALNKKTLKFAFTDASGNSSKKDLTANLIASCGLGSSTDLQRFLVDSSDRILISTATKSNYDASLKSTTSSDGKTYQTHDLETFLNKYGFTADTTKTDATAVPSYDKASVQYYSNLFNQINTNGYVAESDENMASTDWLSNQLNNGNLILKKYNPTATDADGNKGIFQEVDWASGDNNISQTDDQTAITKAEAKYTADMDKVQAEDKQFELSQKNLDTEHSAIQTEYDSVKKIIDKNIERSFKTFNG